MRYKILALLLVFSMILACPAYAAPIKPVADPWDDPNNQSYDGHEYTAYSSNGYIVAWETPECDTTRAYKLIENGTALKVNFRVTYMDSVPWGHVEIAPEPNEDGELTEEPFIGWVLMADLLDSQGVPAAERQPEIPPHPMITNAPEPSPEPAPETPEPTELLPERPKEAITISNTYNNAIVYTSVGIAALALAAVCYLLIKHKALNKKGE